jgi:5-formyltetrahydrofolate cyclo-ligase
VASVLHGFPPFPDLQVSAHTVKEGLRERIRAERRRLRPSDRHAAAHRLATIALEVPDIASAHCVAAYESTPTAPGTLPLRLALRRAGIRVLLPVLLGDGHLDWCEDDDRPVTPERLLGLHGADQAEVVIIPALAVDTLGNRLGQGAGFYDRTLATIDPAVPVFAVVYDGEVLDAAIESVPVEPHDQAVDAILTPHRCLRLLRVHRR